MDLKRWEDHENLFIPPPFLCLMWLNIYVTGFKYGTKSHSENHWKYWFNERITVKQPNSTSWRNYKIMVRLGTNMKWRYQVKWREENIVNTEMKWYMEYKEIAKNGMIETNIMERTAERNQGWINELKCKKWLNWRNGEVMYLKSAAYCSISGVLLKFENNFVDIKFVRR